MNMANIMLALLFSFDILLGGIHSRGATPLIPTAPTVPVVSQEKPVYYKNKAIVLMYHHLDESESTKATLSPVTFDKQMKALKDRGYNVISMDTFLDFMKTKKEIPNNAVLITFDDGYESFYTYAYPILQKYDFVATHFIIGLSTDVLNPSITPHLTWDQMREMKQAGMSFFNHSYNQHKIVKVNAAGNTRPLLSNRVYLPDLKRVETEKEYVQRVKSDLALMEQRLDEELGEQENILAFPYGSYNSTVVNIGRELGIELFFTIKPGINMRGQELICRINAGHPDISAEKLLSVLKPYHEKLPK